MLALASVACEPPPLSPLDAGFEVPDVWPPNRDPAPTTSVTRIDLDTIPALEPIQLVDGPPMQLKTVSLGPPKVLLPKSRGAYYPAEHPLSDRRAMVRRIREDQYGRQMEQYEGYLVDFEDGVVERFDSISPYDQYSKAGIGFAWKTIDGVKNKVLVHADGLVVPMWPETEAAPDLLLHPIWRQAWIFGVERVPTPDPRDDPAKTELRSVYIHWKDLRKPPPSEPKVILPFTIRFDDRVINNEDRSVHGPRPKQQVDVPFVLYGSRDGCNAVELDREGGFHCRYGSYTTLADGWSYVSAEDENWDDYVEFRNRETGEVQIIHGKKEGDDCGVSYHAMQPPRALVHCDGLDRSLVWAPERTVRLADDTSEQAWESDDKLIFTLFDSVVSPRGESRQLARGWTDLERLIEVRLPAGTEREISGYPYHGTWLYTEAPALGTLYATKLGTRIQSRLSLGLSCARGTGFADWHTDTVLLACWDTPPNPSSIRGFDPELPVHFKVHGADNRESLVTGSHVLSTRNHQRELVSWSRIGPPPTSSLEPAG